MLRTKTLLTGCVWGLAWMAGGCASTPSPEGKGPEPEGEIRLTGQEGDDASRALEEMFAKLRSPGRETPDEAGVPLSRRAAERPPAVRPAPPAPAQPPSPMGPPAELARAPERPAPPPPAPTAPTDQERQTALVGELIEMLKQRAAQSDDPAGDAALISILSSLDPAGAEAAMSAASANLDPARRQSLDALRSLAQQLPGAATRDPGELSRLLDRVAQQLGGRVLELPAVVLCSRVESFGRYTPLSSSAFLAGRRHTAILYTEVANFAHEGPGDQDAKTGGEWIVHLSQEVQLLTSDGTTVMRLAPESLRDVSRNPRRDYYLVRRINLPANLSAGAYTLKVVVKDLTSGAVAERNVAITVVVDGSLAGASR
jgi:hypothetical protein